MRDFRIFLRASPDIPCRHVRAKMRLLLRSVSATGPIGWIERATPDATDTLTATFALEPFWSQGLRARSAASDGCWWRLCLTAACPCAPSCELTTHAAGRRGGRGRRSHAVGAGAAGARRLHTWLFRYELSPSYLEATLIIASAARARSDFELPVNMTDTYSSTTHWGSRHWQPSRSWAP